MGGELGGERNKNKKGGKNKKKSCERQLHEDMKMSHQKPQEDGPAQTMPSPQGKLWIKSGIFLRERLCVLQRAGMDSQGLFKPQETQIIPV